MPFWLLLVSLTDTGCGMGKDMYNILHNYKHVYTHIAKN